MVFSVFECVLLAFPAPARRAWSRRWQVARLEAREDSAAKLHVVAEHRTNDMLRRCMRNILPQMELLRASLALRCWRLHIVERRMQDRVRGA